MVEVLFFAALKERVSVERIEIDAHGKSVNDVVHDLVKTYPSIATMVPVSRVAVNELFVDGDFKLKNGDSMALIPPVAGGASRRVEITAISLSVDEAIANVKRDDAGAIVVMLGTVRNHADGAPVERLEYEAYTSMAERAITKILDDAEKTFRDSRAVVRHRTGTLTVGEIAVVVAVSSPHRREAFAACQFIIDELKKDAPIWKREHRASGVVWVGLGP